MLNNLLTFYSTFIFIFSLLVALRLIVGFFKSLLSNPPKPYETTNRELIINGLFVTYIITYLITTIL